MDDDQLRDSLHRLANRAGELAASETLMKRARFRLTRNIGLVVLGVAAMTTVGVAAFGELGHPIAVRPATPTTSPSRSQTPHPLKGEIAFLSDRGPGWGQRVFVLRAGQARPRELSKTQGYSSKISWAPDGQSLVLDRGLGEGFGGLAVVDVRTGAERVLFSDQQRAQPLNPQGPSWSPDGTRIAFYSGGGDIYVIRVDGTHLRRIMHPGPQCLDIYPTWSPDGTKIAFTRDCHDGGIFVVSSLGGRARRLTINRQDQKPSWSPDGSQIAFSRFKRVAPVLGPNGNPLQTSFGGDKILLVDVATRRLTRLTTGDDSYSPSWSPDGSQIVFGSNRGNHQDIWVMNSDGSDQRPLTSGPSVDFAPAWKP